MLVYHKFISYPLGGKLPLNTHGGREFCLRSSVLVLIRPKAEQPFLACLSPLLLLPTTAVCNCGDSVTHGKEEKTKVAIVTGLRNGS